MLFVAGVAISFSGQQFSRNSILRIKEGPFSRKSRLILHMHLALHDLAGLKVPGFVTRHVAFGLPDFEDKNRFVRPGSRLHKGSIRPPDSRTRCRTSSGPRSHWDHNLLPRSTFSTPTPDTVLETSVLPSAYTMVRLGASPCPNVFVTLLQSETETPLREPTPSKRVSSEFSLQFAFPLTNSPELYQARNIQLRIATGPS
jgi:hypothetical protein